MCKYCTPFQYRIVMQCLQLFEPLIRDFLYRFSQKMYIPLIVERSNGFIIIQVVIHFVLIMFLIYAFLNSYEFEIYPSFYYL